MVARRVLAEEALEMAEALEIMIAEIVRQCLKQRVQNAVSNARSRLNQMAQSLSTVPIVLVKRTDLTARILIVHVLTQSRRFDQSRKLISIAKTLKV